MDKRILKVSLAISILILSVVFVFVYRLDSTGRVINWENQVIEGGNDFSHGLPELSPDTLPEDGPLDTRNAIPEACNLAKEERDKVCKSYVESYPKGCFWWHFSFIFECKEKKELCEVARAAVEKECKIA